MRTKIQSVTRTLLLLLLAMGWAVGAGAQVPQMSAAQLKEAQDLGATAAGIAQSHTGKVDADGKPVVDGDGKPVKEQDARAAMEGNLRMFQDVTGQKASAGSSPAHGDVGSSNTQINAAVKFSCRYGASSPMAFGPLSVMADACGGVTAPASITFKVCEKAKFADICGGAADFTDGFNLAVGRTTSFSGISFSLTDCSVKGCTLKGAGTVVFSANASTLTSDSAARASGSGVLQSLRSIATEKNADGRTYAEEMEKVGRPLANCAQANQNAAVDGKVVTCTDPDNPRSAPAQTIDVVATTQNEAKCEGTRECTHFNTTTTTISRSCNRTFPLTERLSKYNYPRTAICAMAETKKPATADCVVTAYRDTSKKTTNSCKPPLVPPQTVATDLTKGLTYMEKSKVVCTQGTAPAGSCDVQIWTEYWVQTVNVPVVLTNSCAPSGGPNQSAGLTTIATTPQVCDDPENPIPHTTMCKAVSWSVYWAQTTNPTLLSQTAAPSPVKAGADSCDTNLLSTTRMMTECDNWFGRLRPESECQVTVPGERGGPNTILSMTYANQGGAGCGFCVAPTVGETCYAATGTNAATEETEDSCTKYDLTSCTMNGSPLPLASSGVDGLVISQKENYTCTKTTQQCDKWSAGSEESSCLSKDMTLGMEKLKPQAHTLDGSFNNAMVAAATIDGTAKGLEATADPTIPKIFNGEGLGCKTPVGGLGGILHKDCCRADLDRPQAGMLIQGGCELIPDVKLAAAKRSHYATYIGEYCSREVNLFFVKLCLEKTQSYCVFPGILPRIVQEQGREQLAKMVASGGNSSIQTANLNFKYYASADKGSWVAPVTVNGVQVSAWQWPSYCADPELAAKKLVESPTNHSCPTAVTSWTAVCDSAAGCKNLPEEPGSDTYSPLNQNTSLTSWTLTPVNPLEKRTTAISRFAVVNGACDTSIANCAYKISAWPVGTGGRAVVTKDLVWPLYSDVPATDPATGKPSPAQYQLNNMGDLIFKGYSQPGPGALPASVPMGFSRDGGQTWVDVQVPTDLSNSELSLPNSDAKISGSCELGRNTCEYRVTGTVTVTAKPWGDPRNPDCSGFTPGQLAVLDFSKMDLSEWLDSVMDKMGATNPTQMASQAGAQFQTFNSMYQSGAGTVKASAPTSANFARVVPAEGFGPFTATLSVSGYWPETTGDPLKDTDKVLGVEVTWGDCSAAGTTLPPVLGGFKDTHEYESPEKYTCLFKNTNIKHTITLTIHTTKSGTQTKTLSVENAWSKFPGADSNNTFIETSTTQPASTNQTNLPPTVR